MRKSILNYPCTWSTQSTGCRPVSLFLLFSLSPSLYSPSLTYHCVAQAGPSTLRLRGAWGSFSPVSRTTGMPPRPVEFLIPDILACSWHFNYIVPCQILTSVESVFLPEIPLSSKNDSIHFPPAHT